MKILRRTWTINEILAMTPGRYCTVADFLVDKSYYSSPPTPKMEESASLIEIDGGCVTVYAIEGKPWDITIKDLFTEEAA